VIILAVLAIVLLGAAPAFAQTGANVAVVVNDDSADSVRIGEHYARVRQVPPDNIIRLKLTPEETISRASYARDVETPIAKALTAHALQDRILYIVLTKGVPLRIVGTDGRNGTGASVDSELTLLYRRMIGRPVPPGGPIANPYYLGETELSAAKPFTHRAHDIFLVTRLGGFTADDAIALVDRAVAPSKEGAIVFDGRGDAAAAIGDRWMSEAARNLNASWPDRIVLTDQSAEPVTPKEPVIGYYSWGSTDRALRRRQLGLRFAPGGLAAMLTSADARTFAAPPQDWSPGDPSTRANVFSGSSQSLIGDLIRDGVTGVAGNVSEPYLESAVRPQILFTAYLKGFNLAESFYLALPSLGWQSVIVGDPLCRPFDGVTLAPPQIEEPVEPTTHLPALFVNRWVESLRTEWPGAPREALLQVATARARLSTGDRAAAKTAFMKAVSLLPDNGDIRLQLASLQEEDGEFSAAVEGYRRVVSLEPRNVIALNNLAYALAVRTKELDEALTIARRAYGVAPEDPNVLDTLGWIEHLKGDSQEAATRLRAAAQRAPNSADIRLHAALVLAKAGAIAEASKHLEAALRLDPSLEGRDEVRELQRRRR
jgi:uncharacterized protein (TIGR03790 family)